MNGHNLTFCHSFFRVDFIDVKIDGQVSKGDALGTSGCDADMFVFRGFKGWTPPPRCGQLKGILVGSN